MQLPRPIDVSLLPFQDLYPRFATRLAQSRWGGEKKSEGAGRHRIVVCSASIGLEF